MKTPITQSHFWRDLQRDLGETCFYENHGKTHYLAILKSTPVGKYLYLPYGPIIKTEPQFEKFLAEIEGLAHKYKAFFIRIEPQEVKFLNFVPANAVKTTDLNPRETWILDLIEGNGHQLSAKHIKLPTLAETASATPDQNPHLAPYYDTSYLPDHIKSKLPSRLLRYYRAAGKKGITIETSHDPADLDYLLDLQKALASKKGINTFSRHYLETELKQPFATLYLVKYQPATEAPASKNPSKSTTPSSQKNSSNPTISSAPANSPTPEVIAAGLVFDNRHTRYNIQGAQSELGKKLHATGILTIQLILDAYKKGLIAFDFWGIAPDGAAPDHPWAGFTAFKKTFAGREQRYSGTYDIVLNPAKYRLYQLFRSLNRRLRKL